MGELTIYKADEYNPAVHISINDIVVDCPSKPSVIELVLRRSKTDRGSQIYLGKTDTELCPVAALLAYTSQLGVWMQTHFFRLEDGTPLVKAIVVSKVRDTLLTLGYNQSHNAGHSFRIGTATTAAAIGIEDSTIQALA